MNSHREIYIKPQGHLLAPFDNFGRQQVLDLNPRKQYKVLPRLSRSIPHHRKYWAMLSECVHSTPLGKTYPTTEILHDIVMRELGYIEYVPYLRDTSRTIEVRKSSAFDAMDQIAFQEFFDDAALLLAAVIGTDPTTLRRRAYALH